jgi:hypothetical protein
MRFWCAMVNGLISRPYGCMLADRYVLRTESAPKIQQQHVLDPRRGVCFFCVRGYNFFASGRKKEIIPVDNLL